MDRLADASFSSMQVIAALLTSTTDRMEKYFFIYVLGKYRVGNQKADPPADIVLSGLR